MEKNRFFSALALALSASLLRADVVELVDGSQIQGEILEIHEGVLKFETSFAGVLEIRLADVLTFSSDDAEMVRFADGSVARGPVEGASDGTISVTAPGGTITRGLDAVEAAWAPAERDPADRAREDALVSQLRTWSYEAVVGLAGRTGNRQKNDFNASVSAVLEGPNDRLRFYSTWQYSEAEVVLTVDGEQVKEMDRTADELIGGVNYTNFFSEHFGWYVRQELERDPFENIDFRSTTAMGLNYRVFNHPTHSLEFTGGLALRYEGYTTPLNSGDGDPDNDIGSESFPGLDFGLKHYWKFAEWGEMNNSVTFNPAFEDFADYRLDQLSTVDFPLGRSDFWKLRVSLQNQYNSVVEPGAEELDTTYALSLLLNWQ